MIGYTQDGGFGWLGRKAGAACSAMRTATIVLADGSVVTASAMKNSDLFWAIRGRRRQLRRDCVHDHCTGAPGRDLWGLVYYRMEDAPEVLRFSREWVVQPF